MQFNNRRRKAPPAVIIISMIDVLLVVLIFLMVTTSFKQQPAVKLALPESSQSKSGADENALIVEIPRQGAINFQRIPVSFERLQEKLIDAVQQNPQATLFIRADTEAPFGQIIKVMDAAKAANIKTISAYTKGSK